MTSKTSSPLPAFSKKTTVCTECVPQGLGPWSGLYLTPNIAYNLPQFCNSWSFSKLRIYKQAVILIFSKSSSDFEGSQMWSDMQDKNPIQNNGALRPQWNKWRSRWGKRGRPSACWSLNMLYASCGAQVSVHTAIRKWLCSWYARAVAST